MADHTSIAHKETALPTLDQRILLNKNTDRIGKLWVNPYDVCQSYRKTMVSVSTQTRPLSVPVVFGAQPIPVWCSHCNKMVTTFIEYESGDYAMFMSCCVTPWAMCADSVKDIIHYCPRCRKELGYYKR
uniref:LITAF domain-containing protein n=1 Tax=Acrobeloides nanus TaxID=290746 RepID=A0A914D3P2_9BILA